MRRAPPSGLTRCLASGAFILMKLIEDSDDIFRLGMAYLGTLFISLWLMYYNTTPFKEAVRMIDFLN